MRQFLVIPFLATPTLSFSTLSFYQASRYRPRCALTTLPVVLPSLEQLEKDPFIRQVAHASDHLVPLLEKDNSKDDSVVELLKAQLSHSDGIRGFFVSYLSGSTQELESVPEPLAAALEQVTDRDDLLSLGFMNVIMPTAMSTLHTDPAMQLNSLCTSQRAQCVMSFLSTLEKDKVILNCRAVRLAASTVNDEEDWERILQESPDLLERFTYWKKFLDKYKYAVQQRRDIRAVAETMLLRIEQ